MKNKFFYNTDDIQKMKELIRTGEPLTKIAKREYANFGAGKTGFLMKLYSLSKTTRKIKIWEGSNKTRKVVQSNESQGINVPKGVSLDFTSKRVVMHNDHVRIYF